MLHWLRRFMAVRRRNQVFGEGGFEALEASNPSVFAFMRVLDDRRVLCVNNLSRFAQPVELDLRAYTGDDAARAGGTHPLPARSASCPTCSPWRPHGFYWFSLEAPQP